MNERIENGIFLLISLSKQVQGGGVVTSTFAPCVRRHTDLSAICEPLLQLLAGGEQLVEALECVAGQILSAIEHLILAKFPAGRPKYNLAINSSVIIMKYDN